MVVDCTLLFMVTHATLVELLNTFKALTKRFMALRNTCGLKCLGKEGRNRVRNLDFSETR